MVTSANIVRYLRDRIRGFEPLWLAHEAYWEGEPAGITNDIGVLVRLVSTMAREHDHAGLADVFGCIETLLTTDADQDAKDAIAVGFLESLVNLTSNRHIDPSIIARHLGPASKSVCDLWDQFTGASRPWDAPSSLISS